MKRWWFWLGLWVVVLAARVGAQQAAAPAAQQAGAPAAQQAGAPAAQQEPPPAAADGALREKSQPAFGLDRLRPLQRPLMGYPLWQYVASLVWVILAFVLAGVMDYVMAHQLRRLTRRTRTPWDQKLLEALQRPVQCIVVLIMLNAGVRIFRWPDWLEKILWVVFAVALAAALMFLAVRLVNFLVMYLESKLFRGDAQLAKLMLPVLSKSLKVFVILIGSLTTAQYLGLPITSVVAGLGIGGVAIALAAQSTLANVFGSITILADRPFRVGDRVKINEHDGMVETIGLRSTRLRTLEGHWVTIPNRIVAEAAISNITLRPNIRHMITLNLTYETSPEKMQEAVRILREIFGNHPLTHDAWVYWRDYGAHSLDIFIIYWCKSTVYKEFLQAMEEINLEIRRRFRVAGLEFAYPTQTIQLQQAKPA